jgi:MFS family permease
LPRALAALPVLRHGNFTRFVISRLCNNLGWHMMGVGVGWQVYALTRDPLALGLVGLWEFLPFISLVLIGGYAADHFERRKVLAMAAAIEALCMGSLLWFTLAGGTRTWPIYLVVAVFGASRAFWAPATQAYLVNLVPREELPDAIALDSMLRQTTTVGGPALGGLLYLLGAPVVYGTCMTLFVITVFMTQGIRVRSVSNDAARSTPGRGLQLLEGVRFMMHNRAVLGLISLDLFAVLFGGATALLPIFAADVLHVGPVGLGLLRSAPAAGALIVGIMLALRPLREHAGAWMFSGVAVFGLATITFGLSTSFLLSLAALAVAGGGDMLSVYVRTIMVQQFTPDGIRGRVSAVNSMFIGASNQLGAFESGVTARWFGTVPSVIVGGCATLVVVGAWLLLFPQLRKLPRLR